MRSRSQVFFAANDAQGVGSVFTFAHERGADDDLFVAVAAVAVLAGFH